MIHIGREEFVRMAAFVRRHSGIELGAGKEYLLETRLQSLLRDGGFSSFAQLCDALAVSGAHVLREKVIGEVSTRETLFFRDKAWFDLLRFKIFPDLLDFKTRHFSGAGRTLTIWSAGCSTGQEVYSVIMAFLETVGYRRGVGIRVLGSDISNEAVSRASYGEYTDFEVGRGLNSAMRTRYFQKVGTRWRVRDEVRALATFSRLNLLSGSLPPGPFDVVLCRNVGIYFAPEDRRRLFQEIRSTMQPPGYLLLGASESLGEGARTGLIGRRHLNALYYVLDGPGEASYGAGSSVMRDNSAEPARVRPARGPVRGLSPSVSGGRGRKVDAGKPPGGVPAPESFEMVPPSSASSEKRGVLASLQRKCGNSLLAKLDTEPVGGVLDMIRAAEEQRKREKEAT